MPFSSPRNGQSLFAVQVTGRAPNTKSTNFPLVYLVCKEHSLVVYLVALAEIFATGGSPVHAPRVNSAKLRLLPGKCQFADAPSFPANGCKKVTAHGCSVPLQAIIFI